MDGLEMMVAAASMAGEWYGFTDTERVGDTVKIRSSKCPMWEAAKAIGDERFPPDSYCRPHELYYQDWAEDLGEPIAFKFTKTLARGDECCEWVMKRILAVSPTTEGGDADEEP